MRQTTQSPPIPNGYIALITVLIIGAVGVTVALFLVFSSLGASQTSFSAIQSSQAKSAADSCSELALTAIQANTNLTTPANGSATIDATNKVQCSYTISGTSPNYTIVSTGTVSPTSTNVVRRDTISLNQVLPQLNVTSWLETP